RPNAAREAVQNAGSGRSSSDVLHLSARIHLAQGQPDAAGAEVATAIAETSARHGTEHGALLPLLRTLADVQLASGNGQAARETLERAFSIASKLDRESAERARLHEAMGAMYVESGQLDAALSEH